MNYNNYERQIVEKYGIALIGWPEGLVRNPSKLGGRPELESLLNDLRSEKCKWVKLTDEELEDRVNENIKRAERGEPIYQPRKKSAKHSQVRHVSAEGSNSGEGQEDGTAE
jgi:hypothetical protein